MIAAACQAAAEQNLERAIVCAIAQHESSWNPWATRYEPAFFEKYVLPLYSRSVVGIDRAQPSITITEAKERATSWGLMQVMGQVARECGFSGPLPSLCDPEIGLEWGCAVFARKLAFSAGDVTRGLEAYNGGANLNYASEVLAIAPTYEKASA